MRTEEKKEPITVTYVGRGGAFDTPCYADQNGRYYFDEKPEWLTMEQIQEYRKGMLERRAGRLAEIRR